jgi:hypothetical protein
VHNYPLTLALSASTLHLVSPTPTTTQRLASLLLETDLRNWVADRRNPADVRRSWRVIANELRRSTNGAVVVTGETLRSWFRDVDESEQVAS